MFKSFNDYINEDMGAISMNRKPVSKLNNPDHIVQLPSTIHSRTSSAIPMHWNNSPYMAGSRYGYNPKSSKKRALSYSEFMKTQKGFSNSSPENIKESDDFSWESILGDNSKTDKWGELEKDMMDLVDKYTGEFGKDSYGVIDAMYQVMDGMFQRKEK